MKKKILSKKEKKELRDKVLAKSFAAKLARRELELGIGYDE